jgi:hypothetical protein
MSGKNRAMRLAMLVLLAAAVAMPMYAGSAVIGSVAGAKDATVGGQALVPSTTLFSGDSLQVKEGVAVIAMGQGSRMVFGHQTQASFLREGEGVTVLLGEGNVSLYQPEAGVGLKVKAGTVTVAPAKGFKTLGEVAMLNGSVVVTAKEGKLKVEGNGPAMEVAKGKTVTLKAVGAASPAPQAGAAGAGAPVSGMTVGEVATVAAAGAAGVGAGFSIAARSKASDAVDAANAATTEAQAAKTAADAATAAAQAACKAVSPSDPACTQ